MNGGCSGGCCHRSLDPVTRVRSGRVPYRLIRRRDRELALSLSPSFHFAMTAHLKRPSLSTLPPELHQKILKAVLQSLDHPTRLGELFSLSRLRLFRHFAQEELGRIVRFDEKRVCLRWIAWCSEGGTLERSLLNGHDDRLLTKVVVEDREALSQSEMEIEGGEKRYWPESMRLDNSMRGGIQEYAGRIMRLLDEAVDSGVQGTKERLKELRVVGFWISMRGF